MISGSSTLYLSCKNAFKPECIIWLWANHSPPPPIVLVFSIIRGRERQEDCYLFCASRVCSEDEMSSNEQTNIKLFKSLIYSDFSKRAQYDTEIFKPSMHWNYLWYLFKMRLLCNIARDSDSVVLGWSPESSIHNKHQDSWDANSLEPQVQKYLEKHNYGDHVPFLFLLATNIWPWTMTLNWGPEPQSKTWASVIKRILF